MKQRGQSGGVGVIDCKWIFKKRKRGGTEGKGMRMRGAADDKMEGEKAGVCTLSQTDE